MLVLFCLPSILLSSQLRRVSAVFARGRLAFMGHAVSFVQRNLAPAIKEKQVVSPLSSVGKFNPTQSKYSKP